MVLLYIVWITLFSIHNVKFFAGFIRRFENIYSDDQVEMGFDVYDKYQREETTFKILVGWVYI